MFYSDGIDDYIQFKNKYECIQEIGKFIHSIEERLYLESRNIGSFDFIYGILILLPMLIFIIKSMKMQKKTMFLNIMIILLIIICIALANFTIAYFFLGISLLLIFIPAKRDLKVTGIIMQQYRLYVYPLL